MSNHMKLKWVAKSLGLDYSIILAPDRTSVPLFVCEVRQCLGDDTGGEKTAQHICDLHNASLKTKKEKK